MADTQRTLSSLQTLLADNTTGAISPQDIRDMLVSVLGGYGGIHAAAAAAEQPNVGTSYATLTCFDTDSSNDGVNVVPAHASDSITINIAGVYRIEWGLAFAGTGNSTWTVAAHLDGVEVAPTKGVRKIGSGGDVGHMSGSGIATVTAGQVLTLRAFAEGATDDITVQAGSLSVTRLS